MTLNSSKLISPRKTSLKSLDRNRLRDISEIFMKNHRKRSRILDGLLNDTPKKEEKKGRLIFVDIFMILMSEKKLILF